MFDIIRQPRWVCDTALVHHNQLTHNQLQQQSENKTEEQPDCQANVQFNPEDVTRLIIVEVKRVKIWPSRLGSM